MANYEHYKMFCKIVECQSISKAAEKLFVTQPAVSLAIKQLETALNVRLFFRTKRGVNLTMEGKILYEYVQHGCNILRAGEEKLKEIDKLETGEISVGASDMTLRFFLLPFIENFHRDFPSLKIKITNAPTPETLQHLKEGRIDFGVISEPFDANNINFKFKPVKLVQDILIAGKDFEHINHLHVNELQKYPFIMLEHGTSTRVYIDKYLKKNDVQITPDIELATSDLIIEFIKRGMGIGFILENFVKNELATGMLHKINITPELAPRQFYIVTHAKLPLSSTAKKLLEFNDIDMSDIVYDFKFFE